MKRVAILGAAGRDCHNFNAVFRSNPTSKVVAFTATQIPDIADLCDPAAVTGERLPPNSEELVPVVQEHTHTEIADRSGKPVRSPQLQPARRGHRTRRRGLGVRRRARALPRPSGLLLRRQPLREEIDWAFERIKRSSRSREVFTQPW